MHDETSVGIARQYAALPPDKRVLFRSKLAEKGILSDQLPIVPLAAPEGRYPLSHSQERLWFLWCLDRESVAYAMCGGLRLRGAVDEDVLEASLVRLVRRHEVLRSRIVESDGVAYQAVSEAASFGWEVRDLAPEGGGDGGGSAWRSAMEEFAAVPFDLERGPLLRCLLLRLSPEERVLVLALHHIVADGWSVGVLLDELSRIYGALRGGVEPDLPALPIQYGDYAVWEREWLDEAFLGEQLSYWRERLGGESPELVLPGERPGPAPLSRRVGQVRVVLGSDLVGRLHRLSQDRGGTLFMTLLAAFQVVLYRASGQSDIRVGVPFAGRRRRETQGLVGFFVNTLVMRGEIAGSARLSEVLDRVRAGVLEAQAHQDVPFGRVVDALEPVRELGRTPLFRVMFNMLEGYGAIEGFEGLEAELLPGRPREAQFDLTLNVEAGRDAVALSFDYAREVFEPAAIEGLASRYEEVLSFFAGDAERRVGELGLGGCLLQPVREVYAFESVTSRIQSQVGARGERLALRCGGAGLSYAGLEGWSSGVARRLLALGVGPEVRVGLCVERSLGLVAGLLGILKCGGAFVPLDASYPRGRLEDMASDAGLDVVVMDGSTAAMLGDVFAGCRIVRVDEVEAGESLTVPVERDRLAYVIYTSGSTGRPKGVAVSHGALSLHLDDFVRAFSYGPEDRVLQFSTFNFDGALEQLLPVLTVGGCAVLRGEELWDWDRLNRCLSEESITVADIPTAYWQQWQDRLPGALPHLRRVTVGGEALAGDALGRWRSSALGGIRLDNRYGPTEATVSALYRETRAADVGETIVPIGRAYPGRGAYVLDGDGNAVPVGGVGELCLSGGSLARGYLGRPGLTAERFVPDPHGPAGSRLYRTGDRCRQRGDGTVEFLGRFDDQVKLRGYRIELGEIEAALRSCRGVRGAAAHLWGAGSERRLVGYAVGEGLDGPALRGELEGRLPSALVPSVVTVLDRLPLTGAGKLDRRALPEPEAAVSARVAARDEREATLLAIWRAVLGRADLGVTDNFFEAGGDSILSLQVVSRARQASLKVTPRQVFEQPTVETLACVAEGLADARDEGDGLADVRLRYSEAELASLGIRPSDVEDIFPATAAQQGLLFHGAMRAEEGIYINQLRLTVGSDADHGVLRACWESAVARHPIMRSSFLWRGEGEALQVVGRDVVLPYGEDDWSALGMEAYEARLSDWRRADVVAGFDISQAPLLRIQVFLRPDGMSDVVLTNHHALLDGWSAANFFSEVVRDYTARRSGEPPVFEAIGPYRDYVAWLAHQDDGEAWWRARLSSVESPTGLLEALGSSDAGRLEGGADAVEEGSVEIGLDLDAGLSGRLEALARASQVTLSTVVQGAWSLVLSRYGGNAEVVFGVTVSGRSAPVDGIEGMVGLFINSLPVWVRLPGDLRVGDWLQGLQRESVELRSYEHTPLHRIQRWAGVRAGEGDGLFDSLVVFENYPLDEVLAEGPEGLAIEAVEGREPTHYAATLTVMPGPALRLQLSCDARRLSRAQAGRLMGHVEEALGFLGADLDGRFGVGRLGSFALSGGLSQPVREHYEFRGVAARISEQASRCGASLAVACEGDRLSYRDLEGWSSGVARCLLELGVGPEVRVGLCVERSPGLVAGLLGILRSGGAFVPLDGSQPRERLAALAADAGLEVAVLDGATSRSLGDVFADCRIVRVDEVEAGESLTVPVERDRLAYVIYTSGSTGRPKGVAVSHGSLSLHMDDCIAAMGHGAQDRVLQFSTVGFDVALEQLLPVLTVGGCAVLRGEELWDWDRLNRCLAEESITVADLPTAYWQQWQDRLPGSLPHLRRVTVGGEALAGDALGRWRSSALGGVRLDNVYGPTEATVSALYRETRAADVEETIVPIGRAYPGRGAYVLDGDGNVAPVGGVGELCLSGGSLARGYLDRPGLTAERFVPDPHGPAGSRLYRTGDRCRQRGDGTVEFLGRFDDQVKLRGYRIELGEIEAALRSCRGVRGAAARLWGEGAERRLVGYAVGENLDGPALRGALEGRLPSALVPSAVMVLDALPLTGSGKLDRRALPEPEATVSACVAPRDEREATLLAIWRAVLGRADLGVTDNFFEAGGDSILSLQVVSRARQAGLKVTPRQVFEQPTIETLARVAESLEDARDEGDSLADFRVRYSESELASLGVRVSEIEDIYPATAVQQGLLFHSALHREDGHYINQVRLTVAASVDRAILRSCWESAVARHPIMRSSFLWQDDGAGLQVVRRDVVLPYAEDDRSTLTMEAYEASLEAWRRTDMTAGFDISQAPLLRIQVFLRPDGMSDVVLTNHHALLDGWSAANFFSEVVRDYTARRSGEPPAIEAVTPYRDYVAWLAHEDDGEAWWRRRLVASENAVGLLEALGDGGGAPVSAEPGSSVELGLVLDTVLSGRLEALARASQVTLSTVVQGAWSLVLSRYGGNSEVVFGVTVSGRSAPVDGIEGMVGLFINSLPVWVRLPGDLRVGDWLQGLQRESVELRSYEHTPLHRIQRWAGVRAGEGDGLFDSLVVFENYPLDEVLAEGPEGLAIEAVEGREPTHYAATLTVMPGPALRLQLSCDARRLSRAQAGRLMGHVEEALGFLGADLDGRFGAGRLGSFALSGGLPQPVRERYEFRGVAARISEQASRCGASLAVVCEGDRLSYRDLEGWSSGVARCLLELGVGPEVRVGLCVERSPGLVAGLLGILRSGGAFVPLDGSQPRERLAALAADAGLEVAVLDGATSRTLGDVFADCRVLRVDEVEAGESLTVPVERDRLAYVIYTSGSTGRPKGVAVSHGSLSLHMDDCIAAMGHGAQDRVLQFSTIGFDVALEQLLPVLTVGGSVVLRGEDLWDWDRLNRCLAEESITLADLPTAYWQQWQDRLPGSLPQLRRVTVGGEALAGDALGRWRSSALGGVRLDNVYGPTEATVSALYRETRAADVEETIVPIGRAYPGRGAYVLDGDGNVAPVGGVGELCLSGGSLARGYLDRPGLTAERFVPDPHGPAGSRLYRTGDRCRQRGDGTVEFLGRFDDQVKLRGYRIELGEIEVALRSCRGVRGAAARLWGEGAERRLVGYAVGENLDGPALRGALEGRLPSALVPSAVMVLDALPLTGSGKLDRRALPEPEATVSACVAPRDEREATLLAIWRAVLGRADLGVTDNFFEAGGDSILSLQVVSRARQAGLKVTPRQVFEQPTIETLARVAETGAGAVAGTAPYGEVPLTPIQQEFFDAYPQGLSHWNQSVLLRVRGELDVAALERVLCALVTHHDALRLRFVRRDGAWIQKATEDLPGPLLSVEELAGGSDWRSRMMDRGEAVQRSLDLGHGPLFRACYVRLDGAHGRLLLVAHHLAVDGVSWRILLEDLAEGYAQVAGGGALRLEATSTPWRVWARELRAYAESRIVLDEAAWWREALVDSEPLSGLSACGCSVTESLSVQVELTSQETSALLASAPRAYRLRVDEVLLAALVGAVCAWSGQRGLLLDLEGHGREDVIDGIDLSRTVGWFTTTYPLWVRCLDDAGAQLREVKERLRAVPNRGLHWGLLGLSEAGRSALSELERAGVSFNYLGRFDNSLAADGLFSLAAEEAGSAVSETSRMSHAIDVNAMISGGVLEVSLRLDPVLMSAEAADALADDFRARLAAMIDHCRTAPPCFTPSDFPFAKLSAADLRSLDLPWSEIETIYQATALQQGLLFHSELGATHGAYINQQAITLGEDVDLALFKACWSAAVARHDVLRSSFAWRDDGDAIQVVLRRVALPYSEDDWSEMAPEAYRMRLEAWRLADVASGFDVFRAPLLRIRVFRRPDGGSDFVLTNHHALMDGWSSAKLFAEVVRDYGKRRSDGSPLPGTVDRYRHYMGWLRTRDDGEAWWRARVSAFPNPVGLLDALGRPSDGQGLGDAIECQLDFDEDLTGRLGVLARRARVTLNTVVQAAWALVLSRYAGSDQVVFGATVSGRSAPVRGIEDMVGLFINSLPVFVRVAGHLSVGEWLGKLQRENAELRGYEHTPLHRIQQWAGLRTGTGYGLFDSLVVFENYPVDEILSEHTLDLAVERVEGRERTHYPLTLAVLLGRSLSVTFSANGRYLDAATIEGLASRYEEVLSFFASDAERRVGELGLGGCLLQPVREVYAFESVTSRIQSQVGARGERLALRCGGAGLSYAGLEGWSSGVARRLLALGVGPEVRVGLCVERSLGLVAGLLGILKCGGAFVPLDASYPRGRLEDMASDAGLDVVVMDGSTAARLGDVFAGCRIVRVDEVEAGESLTVPVERDRLAYVIYTSGSTGRPKGVAVSHGALSLHLDDFVRAFSYGPEDRVLQFSTFNFDGALEQLLPVLTVGGCAVLRGEELWDWDRLNRCLSEESITVADIPTAYWQQWQDRLPGSLPHLRRVTVGGEALAGDALGRWRSSALGGIRLDNRYGPTEATVSALYRETRAADVGETVVPIGRAYPGRGAYVLDGDGNAVPVGGVGELCLSGGSLARGYLGRPGLTAERFVPDPYGPAGSRLYRTGDRCRQRGDGTVEFLGRFDDQVKLRGYRIELGEIEAALRSCRGVRGAAAHLWGEGAERRLVGYAVGEGLDGPALRGELEARLPSALVPSVVTVLDRLPLTGAGKLDRRALPEPEAAVSARVAARDEREAKLLAIWRAVLGRADLGVTDNFFEAGGDSISALRVVAAARREGLAEITLDRLFEQPVIETLVTVSSRGLVGPSNIFKLNASTSSERLFCIHPGFGLVAEYRLLAEALEGLSQVLGVACPTFTEPDWRPSSFGELASDYVRRVRRIQPSGPYRLLGWSLGGWVAHEMTRILESSGEAVEFLGLAEVQATTARPDDARDTPGLEDDEREFLRSAVFDGGGGATLDQLDYTAGLLAGLSDRHALSSVDTALTVWWATGVRDRSSSEMDWAARTSKGVTSLSIEASHLDIVRQPDFHRSLARALGRL